MGGPKDEAAVAAALDALFAQRGAEPSRRR